MSEAAVQAHNSAIASGAAFGGGGSQPSNAASFPHLFCMMFGFNPSGNAMPNLALNNMAVMSKPLAHSPFTLTGKFGNVLGGKSAKPLKPSDVGVFGSRGGSMGME